MQHWYAAYTKPRAERSVAGHWAGLGLQVFLPEAPRRLAGVSDVPREPLFPCYLFARLDYEATSSTVWRWTPGLRHLVAYDDQPVVVPEEIIHLIAYQLEKLAEVEPGAPFSFQPGELVRITAGPFRDLLAIFEKRLGARDRVLVLLQTLDRCVRLELDAAHLEKIPDPVRGRPRRTRGRGRRIRSSQAPLSQP